jgi:8-oxo-dGTP pyrophosphatase MutT (NUDIX family)
MTIEREAVRAIVLDAQENVLLFHAKDGSRPDVGTWWELPGGGLDPGETYLEAVIRELAEEAGLVVAPAQVGAPGWRRSATYEYRGERRISHEVIVPVRLTIPGPEVDGSGRVDFEDEDYFGFRWWPLDAVVTSEERFYPGRVPELILPFLAGEKIDEPFETWN